MLVADSTSVTLYKVLGAAVRARPGRRVVLTEATNFPTDLYVAQGLCETLGLELRAVERDAVIGAIDEGVAVVTLTHVDYRSAAIHDKVANRNHVFMRVLPVENLLLLETIRAT